MQLYPTLLALLGASGASAALATPRSPSALQPRLSLEPVYRRHGIEVEPNAKTPDMPPDGGRTNGSRPMPVPVAGGPSTRGDASLVALAVCGAAGLMMGMMI
ncbi:hypothetical protein MAPG_01700 [Magnaporthiopsis poae ATCC 64411]|uniref:Uncharacterized protein n=1 Tax=Magnaporthiopsis poae (strain ATCC 64411 / 73-15) TaxID=644358 RepID=A0A0C4DPD6_MAGP6|nr:hypothetical protein MAPG_01700 [Magnaporthiopsis poae ATCC 64411]